MGALECAGCAMIAFGPPFSLFVFIIAPDPLRIIIFVAAAFFWLLSLFISSLIWFAVVPLREKVAFGLFASIVFQELFRFFYYLLLKKAEQGLDKVSAKGMHIEGVHSLKNARHTTAFVCGLGFGVMAGAFSLINVLADGSGPGTLGLPTVMGLSDHFATYTFFLISAVIAAAIILLHVAWNVLFWHGCDKRNYLLIVVVIISHCFVSGLTLLNPYTWYYAPIAGAYVVLIVLAVWSYFLAGGSVANFTASLKQCASCRFNNQQSSAEGQAAAQPLARN